MKETTLELKNGLKFYVSGQEITLALQQVNVAFCTGEVVAITGESGSGKSTLAHVLAGIFPCDQGELLINGASMMQSEEAEWESYRREYISFVAQNYGILPGNTVQENVISALLLAGIKKKEAKKRAAYLLKQVDLWKLRLRKAGKLSSGQKQRLSVARAVAKPAPILVADEPTSNLDWGTASKIIKLLAEEAKDRIVIVVTHNFEVIQEYVTRHMVLRDGEVVKDVLVSKEVRVEESLNPAEKQGELQQEPGKEAFPETEEKQNTGGKKTIRIGAYIAKLQLKARPVWACLMLVLFMATAFAVFAFLGSFIKALDDTGTRHYSSELFLNGVDDRLVVIRSDGGRMTEQDYETLFTVPWVSRIERYGVISDINYHYQEGVDYQYVIDSDGGGFDTETTYEEIPQLLTSYSYLQTVPVLREGEEFLKAGRLPMHFDEVVAVGDVSLIGTTVEVFIRDNSLWGEGYYDRELMTIVGVSDIGEGLYFDDRIGIMFWQTKDRYERITKVFEGNRAYYFVAEGIRDDQFWMSAEFSGLMRRLKQIYALVDMKTGEYVPMIRSTTQVPLASYIGVSERTFDALAYDKSCYEISVFLEDYAYAERAMDAIRALGYETMSPFKIGSLIEDDALAKERMNTLVLCLMALVVTILAQVVVLAAMFGTQMGNYVQLRNLGLSCKTGQYSVVLQVLLLTALGQLLGGTLVYLGAQRGIALLQNLMKFLTPGHVAVLSLTHLAASVLLMITVCVILRYKVFPFMQRSGEVDLAELDEEKEGGRG